MALCLQQVEDFLQVVGEYSETCTGFAVMTADEYALTPTLAQIFAVPEPEVMTAAFMSGMSLPLILWLTSWGFGTVVEWVERRTEIEVSIND